MSPAEIVCGHVFGTCGALPPPISTTISVRRALEDAVHPALLRQPCVVAFSGGRDSSLVLAIATFLARRDGVPEPVPVTYVFPDEHDAEEGAWQELVIRHLGLDEWQRVPIHDELDLVGPLAQAHLSCHGVLWPTTLARDVPLLEIARGGSLLDGEGGDEVLGVINHRIAPLAGLIRHPRRLRPRRAQWALEALGPASLRVRRARAFWDAETTPWLRTPGRQMLVETLERGARDEPLAFDASVRRVPIERHHVLAARNRHLQARTGDVEIHSPLVHPEVVHALAREGGWLGPGSRTDVLRTLVPDLLPDEVLARTTKADFTGAYLGALTREFAGGWDGRGVDHQLVDAEELRRSWLGAEPHALTAALLQQAWLACSPPG
jgi:hypothetical protein